jgi:hypothetical protein
VLDWRSRPEIIRRVLSNGPVSATAHPLESWPTGFGIIMDSRGRPHTFTFEDITLRYPLLDHSETYVNMARLLVA